MSAKTQAYPMRRVVVLAKLHRKREAIEFNARPIEWEVLRRINGPEMDARVEIRFKDFPFNPARILCVAVRIGRFWLKLREIQWITDDDGARVRFELGSTSCGPMTKRQAREWLCGVRK